MNRFRVEYFNLWKEFRIIELLPKVTLVGPSFRYGHHVLLEIAFLIFSVQLSVKKETHYEYF